MAQYKTHNQTFMEHNVGNDRQHVFIQVHVLPLIYVTPAGCAQVMYRVFMLFQGGKKELFSQMWALSFEDRQTYAGLLFQGKMPASHYVELR